MLQHRRRNNVEISGKTNLPRLPNGDHKIIVYATDIAGNGVSETIQFCINIDVLSISLLSPKNQTYITSELPLNVTLSETAVWTSYSLDGQENVTFTGYIKLSNLAYGSHKIIVYANDTYGNIATSEILYFSVLDPFSTLWIAALTAISVVSGVFILLFFLQRKKQKENLKLNVTGLEDKKIFYEVNALTKFQILSLTK